MNKDKAIQLLERLQDPEPYEPMLTKDAYDAIQMAIDALSADSDTISRQAAIDALDKRFDSIPMEQTTEILLLRKDLRELPPAQPKRGMWIYCEDSTADCVDGYRCDKCGFFVPWDYTHKSIDYIKDYNFCPKCGSYNGGENEI